MNEYIIKRKSIRKYKSKELDLETIKKIQMKIKNVKPLYSNINYSIEIISPIEESTSVDIPYFLVFYSEKSDNAYENIGFIGQQLNLYFAYLGIGACWRMNKPDNIKNNNDLSYIISMSFGKVDESLYRELSEFDRKPIYKISEGNDKRLESARLAPSGLNTQNWYFIAENNKIHCYCKKLNFLVRFIMNKLNHIDMGIAICHIFEESIDFKFLKDDLFPKKEGFVYIGTVS